MAAVRVAGGVMAGEADAVGGEVVQVASGVLAMGSVAAAASGRLGRVVCAGVVVEAGVVLVVWALAAVSAAGAACAAAVVAVWAEGEAAAAWVAVFGVVVAAGAVAVGAVLVASTAVAGAAWVAALAVWAVGTAVAWVGVTVAAWVAVVPVEAVAGPATEDKKLSLDILALVHGGQLSRAMARADAMALAAPVASTIAALRALHPPDDHALHPDSSPPPPICDYAPGGVS